jgi:hypothetical protein
LIVISNLKKFNFYILFLELINKIPDFLHKISFIIKGLFQYLFMKYEFNQILIAKKHNFLIRRNYLYDHFHNILQLFIVPFINNN